MEHRISKGWRIFIYIGMSLFIILSIWIVFTVATFGENDTFPDKGIMLLIALSLALFSIYSIIRTRKEKVKINNVLLEHSVVFSKKKIDLDEIDGFRVDEHYIHIIPKDSSVKNIRISSYLDNKYDFIGFLNQRLKNLDDFDYQKEFSEILSNNKFGEDDEERIKQLEKAQKTVKAFMGFGLFATFWLIIYPHPYDLSVLINVLIPMVALGIFYNFNGLVKLDSGKQSEYPDIASILFLPSCGLGLRILFDFEILSFKNVWTPTIIVSIIFFGLFFIRSEELKKKNISSLINTFLTFLLIALHTFTSIIMLNYLFDFSSPSVYPASVKEKINPTDDNNYRLIVESSWEIQAAEEIEITVTEGFFYHTEIEDTVFVQLYPGAFNIPWLKIDELKYPPSKETIQFSFPEDTSLIDIFE